VGRPRPRRRRRQGSRPRQGQGQDLGGEVIGRCEGAAWEDV